MPDDQLGLFSGKGMTLDMVSRDAMLFLMRITSCYRNTEAVLLWLNLKLTHIECLFVVGSLPRAGQAGQPAHLGFPSIPLKRERPKSLGSVPVGYNKLLLSPLGRL